MREENRHQSEMVSQVLYGESVEIIEVEGSFSKIKMDFDGYEGWIDTKQLTKISEEYLKERKTNLVRKIFDFFEVPEGKMLLSLGSEIEKESEVFAETDLSKSISEVAQLFINVPYLWSGRSFFGIDCSGFSQIIYKVHGINLPRDAYQQAEKGSVLDFIEESKPGDLAFFENQEGEIVHVGILLSTDKIIHAYGKVRIDDLDYAGIYNKDLKKHTHKLRFVKSYF